MKKLKKWQIAVAIIVVVGGGYYWYQKAHAPSTQLQYVTAPAEKGTLTTSVSGSGNVVVDQSENIDPTITGTVSNLAVNVGDKVKKGQILFSIVNDQLGIAASSAATSVTQSQQSLESAKAAQKQAQYNYDHNSSGLAQKKILNNQLQAANTSLDAAQQNIDVANEKYQSALSDVAKMSVTAPIAGTVNAVNIKNGDDLSKLSSGSSRTVPIIIGDLATSEAQVQINEVDVPNVQLGQKAMMTFSAISGLTVSGKVVKMDSLGTVTQGVVTYNATISFDTLDPRIKPGMSVSANIITSVKQDVITVPNSAIKTKGNATYVQVLPSGQTVPQQVSVQTGAANNTDTEITSGLNVGDNVVTKTINLSATTTTTTTTSGGGAANRLPGIGGRGFGG
jgi:RND family efflux transporter MFP subunit